MNGNLPLIIEDAKKLGDAVFGIYPTLAEKYKTTIGPVVSAEQQKILFDLAVACIGIANKESRVASWKEEKKNGNGNSHSSPPMPPQPPKPPQDKEPIINGSTQTAPSYRQRDTRDRPTEQLIQELNIKSPQQAGFLRLKKEISYKEWQRVRDYVSQQEIANGRSVRSPQIFIFGKFITRN